MAIMEYNDVSIRYTSYVWRCDFLTSSGDQKKSRTIVGCMIQMVELLEMKMIAEGVETVEQAEFLRNRGCPEMQGYYFFKPMPVEEFEKLSEEIWKKDCLCIRLKPR